MAHKTFVYIFAVPGGVIGSATAGRQTETKRRTDRYWGGPEGVLGPDFLVEPGLCDTLLARSLGERKEERMERDEQRREEMIEA